MGMTNEQYKGMLVDEREDWEEVKNWQRVKEIRILLILLKKRLIK